MTKRNILERRLAALESQLKEQVRTSKLTANKHYLNGSRRFYQRNGVNSVVLEVADQKMDASAQLGACEEKRIQKSTAFRKQTPQQPPTSVTTFNSRSDEESMLTHVSLSDISAGSLIGLPIDPASLRNRTHYNICEPNPVVNLAMAGQYQKNEENDKASGTQIWLERHVTLRVLESCALIIGSYKYELREDGESMRTLSVTPYEHDSSKRWKDLNRQTTPIYVNLIGWTKL